MKSIVEKCKALKKREKSIRIKFKKYKTLKDREKLIHNQLKKLAGEVTHIINGYLVVTHWFYDDISFSVLEIGSVNSARLELDDSGNLVITKSGGISHEILQETINKLEGTTE